MRLLQPVQVLDISLFRWCMARRYQNGLSLVSRYISATADGWMYLLFISLYGMTAWPESSGFVSLFSVAFIIERLVYFSVKNLCRRHRPAEAFADFSSVIVPSDRFSFPSGHTSAAFLFATLVASQFPIVTPLLLLWACLVALSRVFLGVHFPSDTLVGAVLGTSIGLLVIGAWL